MTHQTAFATPEPDDAATSRTVASTEVLPAAPAQAQPAPGAASAGYAPPASAPISTATKKRTLGAGAIVGIVFGAMLVATLIFGGGIAVGLAIPTGGSGAPGTSQGGLPGGPGSDSGTGQGTRPEAPRGGTNQERPTAPNSDDTGTGDSAEEG